MTTLRAYTSSAVSHIPFISVSVEVGTIGTTKIEFFVDIVEFLIIRITPTSKEKNSHYIRYNTVKRKKDELLCNSSYDIFLLV